MGKKEIIEEKNILVKESITLSTKVIFRRQIKKGYSFKTIGIVWKANKIGSNPNEAWNVSFTGWLEFR